MRVIAVEEGKDISTGMYTGYPTVESVILAMDIVGLEIVD